MSLWTQLGQDINGEASNDKSGYSVALSSDGSIVAIGAPDNNENHFRSGQVKVYQYNNGWVQLGQAINGEASNDNSGFSIALSSNGLIVAIGAPYNDSGGANSGQVRVYQYNNGWVQLGQAINGEASNDNSGYSIALSSNGLIVAIGAIYNDSGGSDSGQVRIYQYTNNTWSQLGQDIDGAATGERSGQSVALSSNGSIVAIGAPFNDDDGNNSGQVRVYQYTNNTWSQLGQAINGETSNDYSGWSVSLSSDGLIVAIGAPYNDGGGDDSGQVRVYQYTNNTWSQLGQDINGETSYDYCGYSVSLSSDGSIVAIGARRNDEGGSDSGQVRIYQYTNNTWSQLGQDINGETSNDQSGWAVSLSSNGSIVAIGAPFNDDDGNDSGQVRVYQYPTSNIVTIDNEAELLNFMNGTSTYGNITNSLNIDYDLVAENYKVLTGDNITITKSI